MISRPCEHPVFERDPDLQTVPVILVQGMHGQAALHGENPLLRAFIRGDRVREVYGH